MSLQNMILLKEPRVYGTAPVNPRLFFIGMRVAVLTNLSMNLPKDRGFFNLK